MIYNFKNMMIPLVSKITLTSYVKNYIKRSCENNDVKKITLTRHGQKYRN